MTLERQMEHVQHNFIFCLLLKKPRPVALGVQSHFPRGAGLPFHSISHHSEPDDSAACRHRTMSLRETHTLHPYVCLVLPPPPGPPSLPVLLEKLYPSSKVRLKCSSLKPPLISPSHAGFTASALIMRERWEHTLLFRT